MIIEFLVGLVKDVALLVLKALFPFHLINVTPPSFSLDSVLGVITMISTSLSWMFGSASYAFFVTTVLITTLALPTFHLSVFFVRLAYRVRSFF